ncbi:HPr family phosphocarrier protein [Xenorhabdus doucetiae]|uniref:Phosphocarrier protein HPr n=1 Tax=Xenorhabdus doucetiae TaxID=351671 RepID=A0A068QPD9_9GAMM|nr:MULTISPECIES: HPr family phosphocarrier protein [Xenorhabdus]MBD2784049.1 HPr family phosphocarrier protein [Xenorhabdus sp. 3]MBD2787826.1 HPr family phosphocarrier protein [Xenorhabdus sp. DI]MBD2795330.1 HPr family phosphocarrier protein [Xenorhabdus sp. 18]TYP16587.1 phosphocarrier protein HPr/phosphocarrier protein [Xenorhabdus doucetiae]CDG16506.1 Phosphotransferase system HPr enzyme [Xenorhabdus doucetiae]
MIEYSVVVTAPSGLHTRPCAQLCNFAKNYAGKIEIIRGEKNANLKSMFKVMSMGIKNGMEVIIRVEGDNEQEMAQSVVEFIRNIKD